MGTLRFAVCVLWGGLLLMSAHGASGQEYPSRPIRIVTAAPGSGNDFAARLFAPGLSRKLGQQVLVENRGGGVLAIDVVAKAAPDGYTLLFYGSPFWILPLLRSNLRYDPFRDFSAITLATEAPNVLVVHPSVPAKSVKELIALGKAKPGQLNYGSGSTGSTSHLAAELFAAMAGVRMVRIAYKGAAPALIGLLSGEFDLIFPSASSALPYIKAGKLRALAVASPEPSQITPGLPTMAAAGLPGYRSSSILGIFAPAGTPAPIIDRLNRELVDALRSDGVRERLFKSGVEVVGSTPAELSSTIKSESARWGKLLRNLGIHE